MSILNLRLSSKSIGYLSYIAVASFFLSGTQVSASSKLPEVAEKFLMKHENKARAVPRKIRRSRLFSQRWRGAKRRARLPRKRRHIVVNILEQMLYAFDRRGRIAFTSKVILGKAHTPTPAQRTRIQTGKFSPAWTAPTSIGFEKLDNRVNGGLKVRKYDYSEYWQPTKRIGDLFEAVKTDLDGKEYPEEKTVITARDMLRGKFYFFIPPSNTGPLGPMKFVLRKSDGIYLHGTMKKELFAKSLRLESHGCVRVEKIEDLATWVYRKPRGWVDDEISKEKEHYMRVRGRKVPVTFTYFLETNWDGKGRKKHDDVYNVLGGGQAGS